MNTSNTDLNKSVKGMQKAVKELALNLRNMDKSHVINDGNNGGDFIDIKNVENGTVHLRVGNCCVKTIDSIVPVEFISMLLTREVLLHGSIEVIIDSFDWDKEFKEKLKSKVMGGK